MSTSVFAPKGQIHFPPKCPMCLQANTTAKVTVSDRKGHVCCDVGYCKKCAGRIGWHDLVWYGPALRVREVSNKWVVFQFKSARYAQEFLDINPAAFQPNRGWRWLGLKKLLILLLRSCYEITVPFIDSGGQSRNSSPRETYRGAG
jgi:hypothetical protein